MSVLPDYYEILQVSPNADVDIIQAAHKRLAFKWHPDRRPGDPMANERMTILNAAYEILSNVQKRRAYDESRRPRAATRVSQEAAEQRERADAAGREEERQHAEAHSARQERERRAAAASRPKTTQPPRAGSRADRWARFLGLYFVLFVFIIPLFLIDKVAPTTLVVTYCFALVTTPLGCAVIAYVEYRDRQKKRFADSKSSEAPERPQPSAGDENSEQERNRQDTKHERQEQERLRRDAERAVERRTEEERRRIEAQRIEREQERPRRNAQVTADRLVQEEQQRNKAAQEKEKADSKTGGIGNLAHPDQASVAARSGDGATTCASGEDAVDDAEDTALAPELEALVEQGAKVGYLTFDQVGDYLGVTLWQNGRFGRIEIAPDTPENRRAFEQLLPFLEDEHIRVVEEGDATFCCVPGKPWFDAEGNEDDGDREDNDRDSSAWRENAIRAMEGD
jgi:hypothetical protein